MTTLSNGHTAEEFGAEELAKYLKDFPGAFDKFIRVNPGGWVLPDGYLRFEEKLTNFKFRPSDVVIMTYPKCGTTWTQEIVYTMRDNPNLDNPEAETALFTRSPFIDSDMLMQDPEKMKNAPLEANKDMPDINEMPMMKDFLERCPGKDIADGLMLQLADAMTKPRTLKTHMPFSLLNRELIDTCKVIYVVRNPKDVVLSYQHHCRLMKAHGFKGTQDAFVQYFVDDMLLWGSYANHLNEAWRLRTHPNLRIIFYEDLKANTKKEVKKLASFLGVTLTHEQLKKVLQKTSFSEMKTEDPLKMDIANFFDKEIEEKDGTFFRKGEAGSWRKELTPEQSAKVDDWVEKKKFSAVGFEFKYQ